VPPEELPREADVEAINSSLSDGLQCCRAVVANYRAMLGREINDNISETPPANDQADGDPLGDTA
jgi:hypothetical protein